jgi:hypothetical protein
MFVDFVRSNFSGNKETFCFPVVASPKSPTLTFRSESRNTLLGFKSLFVLCLFIYLFVSLRIKYKTTNTYTPHTNKHIQTQPTKTLKHTNTQTHTYVLFLESEYALVLQQVVLINDI